MNVEVISKSLQLEIYGFGGVAVNKDYTGTAFKLSGKMWEYIKSNNIKNKGKNIWVYENADKVFTGVELENEIKSTVNALEQKKIHLVKYAYYKHIGPYSFIRKVGENMRSELAKQGYEIILPYIEIYGHWSKDESKSETEIIMNLKV
jgi:Bacterial transcription activator, effector binding domain.